MKLAFTAAKIALFILVFLSQPAVANEPLLQNEKSPVTIVDESKFEDLIKLARAAQDKSYVDNTRSPVKVGVIIKTTDGKYFTGSNIKLPCGLDTCAERVALHSAIHSMGGENLKIDTIVIESNLKHGCPPCGVCRQALSAFSSNDTKLIFRNKDNQLVMGYLKDLLPLPYSK